MTRLALLLTAFTMAACTQSQPATQVPAPSTPEVPQAADAEADPKANMGKMADITIGGYTVQPFFEEELKDGHFNLKVSGGEFKAVRMWVGPEDASGVMVVKAEVEDGYQHGHVEIPEPAPADAKLWVEIETPAGETLKGSTPLAAV